MRVRAKVLRYLSTIAVTAAAATALPASVQAAESSAMLPREGTIRTFAGKCLDVHRGSQANGAPIIQYTCGAGKANQRFAFIPVGGGLHKIHTTHTRGKCLDVANRSTRDEAPIIQYSCKPGGSDANQRFRIVADGGDRVVVKTFAGKCFDVKGASTAVGAPLIQYRCKASGANANQRFRVVA
ncbi:RICIN domain-containing protein [Streptomyces sp. AC536]|uniref:RICIN domain-containing protein n=1 Tax=Streptomyces buecherae TaxID=2763006 RepID=UPI00164E7FFE|nr:RICIN domain-containing protein [Streptomyces buecherae]MBC3986974.1 RICIN domain-containing protein [Streptomyces buecherae]QNJ42577.1 RICIN domain-containing protein [Streptomyces buecherae]